MVHKKKYDVVTTFLNYDLHGAAAAGNIGLVTYAITHGQPINAVLGGLLPIHAAASGGSVEVVQLLIDNGADVNIPRLPSSTGPPINIGGPGQMVGPGGVIGDSHQCTTAGEKLHKGRLGSAGLQAPPSSASTTRPGSSNGGSSLPVGLRGSTPLHFAAALGHLEVARILLENGANPLARDIEKATPEMVARSAGRQRVADFIRDWRIDHEGAPRRSIETPQQPPSSSGLKPEMEFGFRGGNISTASLPLTGSAAQSTASLGRYANQPGRRPSLPSIHESPPSTSYPRPPSGKKQQSFPSDRPATASSAHEKESRLPFTVRRPKSANSREGKSSMPNDDATSQISHHSGKESHGAASRLNKLFRRPNLRPATASGALSIAPSPSSPSPPTLTRTRSPSASGVTDKDRGGGLFHGHHLPPLSKRDHGRHLHPHTISRDAISGPIMNGQQPSTSIAEYARPDLADGAPSTTDDQTLSRSPDDLDEVSRVLNRTPAELQYMQTRGALPDRAKHSAPAGQTTFGLGRKSSGSGLRHYPSHSALPNKPSPVLTPNSGIVPRHRAKLGPGDGLAMTAVHQESRDDIDRARTDTPLSFGSDQASPAPRSARPVPSFTSLNRTQQAPDSRDERGSISSHESSNLTGTNSSADALRSPEGGEELASDYISRPLRSATVSTNHSPAPSPISLGPGGTSPSIASPGYAGIADYNINGSIPMSFIDPRQVSTRAQAAELVEAHARVIQTEYEQRQKAKRLASNSSHKNTASPLGNTRSRSATTDTKGTGPSESDGDDMLEEEDRSALRERLAALGESLHMERVLARNEQLAKRFHRESAADDGSTEGGDHEPIDRMVPSSMGPSTNMRAEMLEGYLRKGEASDTEKVKRPVTPKRDVFGRPVTPKQREGRPTTPKEARPTTPRSVTPQSSTRLDAPRENRVLPPPSKAQTPRSNTHLTLQQTRVISKSDLGLNSHINKDDLQGRERAWTTTDVRPRIGPQVVSRPSTAGAKPADSQRPGGLTIDIVQTMPTPTDGRTPLEDTSPIVPPSPDGRRPDSIQSRRRMNSNQLRIDSKVAQEQSHLNESSEEAGRPRSASRPRKPSTPTGSGSRSEHSVLITRVTPPVAPPVIALVPPRDPYNSFLSVGSDHEGSESPVSPSAPPEPVPALPSIPSAVDLHNMLQMQRVKDEARMIPDPQHSPIQLTPSDIGPGGSYRNSPPASAAERRLGLSGSGRSEFGYESVRSFNQEKGGDNSRALQQVDTRESDYPKPTRSKFGGLFSRKKR